MKRKSVLFVAIAALFLSTAVVKAQFNPYSEDVHLLTVGIGVSGWGVPIFARFETPVAENITVGGSLSYQSYGETAYWKHTIIGITARGSYHFNELLELTNDKIDLYGGLSLGYYIWNTKSEFGSYTGAGSGGLSLGVQAGGRYFLTDNIGLNVEFGGGSVLSAGTLGVTFLL